MSQYISITSLGGKQFLKARTLQLPVIFDGESFRLPSATGGEGEHVVRFDSLEEPLVYSCTCRAGRTGTPCWAAARSLDVLTLLSVNNVYVERAARRTAVSPEQAPLEPGITEGGELALMVRSATPLAGMVLNIP